MGRPFRRSSLLNAFLLLQLLSSVMDALDGSPHARLLPDPVTPDDSGKILYQASFKELEESFLTYDTVLWVLISLLLILAWGVGIPLLLYTPVRRYVMRQDFRSRQLYVTSDAVVYKVVKPIFIPWFGVSQSEKCILLPLITDIILEQGCLQSIFGLHSIRIDTLGQERPVTAHSIHICGISEPRRFRKAVLKAASAGAHDVSLSKTTYDDSGVNFSFIRLQSQHQRPSMSHQNSLQTPRQESYFTSSDELVLRKLEEMNDSVKRLEVLIEGRQG